MAVNGTSMPGPPRGRFGSMRPEILSGSVRRAVFLLALPVLCEQFLSFLVGFTDTWLSGRIDARATTAIGLGAYVGWLASMLFSLVGTGTTALVSRFWGADQRDDANLVMNRSIALATLLGALVYVFIFVSAPLFAVLLQIEGDSREIVVRYLRVDGFGHLFSSVSLIGAAALRGAGNMRAPMFILGMVSVLNVLISSLLVFGIGPFPLVAGMILEIPSLGIDGIVLGTVAARFIGGVLMIVGLARGLGGLRLNLGELSVRGDLVRRILRIGFPAVVDGGLQWAGHFAFLMIIARLASEGRDSAIFAAHIIGIRVEGITYLPAVAWGVASATMVGQALGAGNRERAVRAGHEAVLQCSLFALVITIAFCVFAQNIFAIMHEDAAVVRIGGPALQLLGYFQIPLVVSIVYVFALRGSGNTRTPMLINLGGVLLIRLPVAYVCGHVLDGGLIGAWMGMFADILFRSVAVLICYWRGDWTKTEV